jgi:hypothetical protein
MRRLTPLVRGRAHASGAARRSLREVVWRGRPRASDELRGVSQIQAIGLITGRRRPEAALHHIRTHAVKPPFAASGGLTRSFPIFVPLRE